MNQSLNPVEIGRKKNYGRSSLHEFLADRVLYRNLEPADPSLPGLAGLRPGLSLPEGRIPRKSEVDYARVVIQILYAAQERRGVRQPLRRLLFVGDTRLLDGTAFSNLCLAGNWPGLGFIGSEDQHPASVQISVVEGGGSLYLANRWAALPGFDAYAGQHGFPVDEATAVVIDIDKTALGARGRNGHVIDAARVQAVQETVSGLLGEAFDLETFRCAYDRLNQPEFHPFTGDNQDYLAYCCLILGSGMFVLEDVVTDVREKRLLTFSQLIDQVEARREELPVRLREIHAEIYRNVKKGDPTPFKSFRRNEYLATIR
ncbi:MAG: hypothetical protein ACM3PY_04815, partial [Omnitrophica WOR_2 bacterium]